MPDRSPTVVAYISAGSSIEPRTNLLAATDMLRLQVKVKAVSTVRQTPAIGRPNDPDFWNCVFQVETSIPPRQLKLAVLHEIERAIGREPNEDRYAPRKIDLDLILYGQVVTDDPDLKLPHPDLSRPFVRAALLEIAPEFEPPGPAGDGELGAPLLDFTECLRRRLER